MELHMDGGIHHGMMQGICPHDNMPNLQHVSFGDYTGDSYEEEHHPGHSDNDDTDYDLNEEDEEEEDEEEDEDENSEDDSQIHALIDDQELKFRLLVSAKIGEAEDFFDDVSKIQRPVYNSTLTEPLNSAQFLDQAENEAAVEEPQAVTKSTDIVSNKSVCSVCNDASTQTDEGTSLVRPEVGGSDETTPNDGDIVGPEKARAEIGKLRDVRESLISQRRQWADQLKRTDEKDEDESKKAESKVYELEEAIEAVDTAIEFKNEVVLGHSQSDLVSGTIPGSNEAQLVTRLETLTIQELQRLLCLYFAKVVELRSSSRKLEKQLEHAENSNDQLSRRLGREHKRLKEMRVEYESRIRLLLSSNPNSALDSYLRLMNEQLAAAQKRQHDLEGSLTELLVRHGYLVNGADYDVKQVVKMLGIEKQLATTTHRDGSATEDPQPHHSRSWYTGGIGGWPSRTKNRFPGLSHRRNGRVLDGHELQSIHHRDARLMEGWERERERQQRHVQQAQPTEVRREKHRIIIQPSNSQPQHGSPSNHNHHHYSHPHSHQPPYGPNQHGYK